MTVKFSAPTVEWVVTDTGRARIRDRHGVDFDESRFTAEALGIDGLRLWTDAEGRGLLVREDAGTGWARNTVVSAYSADMVEYRRLHDTRPFVPMPMPIGKPADAPRPKPSRKPTAQAFVHVDQAVFDYIAKQGRPVRCAEAIEALSLRETLAAHAFGRLAKAGMIERVSRTAGTWQLTPFGAESIGAPPPDPVPPPPPPPVSYEATLRYLAECTKSRDAPAIAKRTGQPLDDVSQAINALARKGWIERVSKKRRTWQCTEAGRAAAKEAGR